MTIILYQNTAEPERVEKTTFLTQVEEITGVLREGTSIINPSILVQKNDMPTPFPNYAYIPEFNRYYFIDNIITQRNKIWILEMTVDVLMTYKTQILSLTATIARQEFNYDAFLIDTLRPTRCDTEVEYDDGWAREVFSVKNSGLSDASIPTNDTSYNYILSVSHGIGDD